MDSKNENFTYATDDKKNRTFQRSYSLPPSQRKHRKLNFNSSDNENNGVKNFLHYDGDKETGTTNKTEESFFKHRFGSMRQKFRVTKKVTTGAALDIFFTAAKLFCNWRY